MDRSPVRLLSLGVVALALTACGGGDGASTGAADTAEADSTVSVTAGDMFYEPTTLSTDAGTVAIELVNEGQTLHNLVVESSGTKVAEAEGGASDTGTVELESGTYTFYCDVPGHRQAGMEGTLEVA